jgi:hypothetical protein
MTRCASPVFIAGLFTLLAATTGCEAQLEQSDADLSALPPKSAVTFYCAQGKGTLDVPDDAESNTLAFNSLLTFAHKNGDFTLEECDEKKAQAWEAPLVAGRLDGFVGWVLRWGRRGEAAAPVTGTVLRSGGKVVELGSAVRGLHPFENFVHTLEHLKLSVPAANVVRVGERTGLTVVGKGGRTAQLVFSSENKAIVEVHNYFEGIRYSQALVDSTVAGIRAQNAALLEGSKLLVHAVKVSPKRPPQTGLLSKLLPVRKDEYIYAMQFTVECKTPAELERALTWIVELKVKAQIP